MNDMPFPEEKGTQIHLLGAMFVVLFKKANCVVLIL